MLRFLYLNAYSFLLVFAGALAFLPPFHKISIYILLIQAIIAIKIWHIAAKLFSSYKDKIKKREILVNRNQNSFRPDTFDAYMQAPCGRLIVRSVLSELGKTDEYKNLLKRKKPFFALLKENCTPAKTIIYINEEVI